MDGHCLSPYNCKCCIVFKQSDRLNFDGLAGKCQKHKNFPPSKFCTHCVNEHYHKRSIQGVKREHLVHCNKFSHTSLLVGSAINKGNHTGDQAIELLYTDI